MAQRHVFRIVAVAFLAAGAALTSRAGEVGLVSAPAPDGAVAQVSPQSAIGYLGDPRGGDCAGIAGTWQWFNGDTVVIRADGRLEGRGVGGSWEALDRRGRRYRLRWDSGYVDDLELAADGGRLEGTNQKGTAVSANRDCRGGGGGGADCTGVAGTWQWFNGDTVVVRADGRLEGRGVGGSWEALDRRGQRYRLRWDSGYVDDLELASDGGRLVGTNQKGTAVSATRDCRGGGGADCTGFAGTWRWFNGDTVVIRADGRLEGRDVGGSWEALDRRGRRCRLRWDSGYVDDLELASDGGRLVGTNQKGTAVSATRDCRGGGGRGVCDDRRILARMDDWLARAVPPQRPGEELRYDAWGRLTGRSLIAEVTASGPPDTRLGRCEWLWVYAPSLSSTNGLGTLQQFLERGRPGLR